MKKETLHAESDAPCRCREPTWRWDSQLCSHCGDVLPDPLAEVIAWLRSGCGTGDTHAVRSPSAVADAIERGEHRRAK